MAANNRLKVERRRGESIIVLARPGTLADTESIPSSYACKAGLFELDGTAEIAAFDVTQKHTFESVEYFLVELGRNATKGISEGNYTLAIDISNASVTPEYSDESAVDVTICGQLIALD